MPYGIPRPAFVQINAEYTYGIQRVLFPNRTVFIQPIDAVNQRQIRVWHLSGRSYRKRRNELRDYKRL